MKAIRLVLSQQLHDQWAAAEWVRVKGEPSEAAFILTAFVKVQEIRGFVAAVIDEAWQARALERSGYVLRMLDAAGAEIFGTHEHAEVKEVCERLRMEYQL